MHKCITPHPSTVPNKLPQQYCSLSLYKITVQGLKKIPRNPLQSIWVYNSSCNLKCKCKQDFNILVYHGWTSLQFNYVSVPLALETTLILHNINKQFRAFNSEQKPQSRVLSGRLVHSGSISGTLETLSSFTSSRVQWKWGERGCVQCAVVPLTNL